MDKASNTLYDDAEVRAELVKVREEIRRMKRQHIDAFGDRHDTSFSAVPFGSMHRCGKCHVCESFNSELWGVNQTIRHFGGRPRG